MTRVCLIGGSDVTLQYELLSRETAREALSTYDLTRPFANSIALRTISLGAAVSLLNDLNWYLTRFADTALVQEPSVSDEEWLSRSLATQLRNGTIDPAETDEYCKIYGVETSDQDEPAAGSTHPVEASSSAPPAEAAGNSAPPAKAAGSSVARSAETGPAGGKAAGTTASQRRLVEPLYVRRTDTGLPEYDLRDVEETVVVRLTESEYEQ